MQQDFTEYVSNTSGEQLAISINKLKQKYYVFATTIYATTDPISAIVTHHAFVFHKGYRQEGN